MDTIKNKVCICAILKDEYFYLKEWIDWHLSLGIEHIYLYEDYNSISHAPIVSEYDNVHLYYVKDILESYYKDTILDKHNAWKQYYIYEYFYNSYRNKYEWIMFIDIDEFLILKDVKLFDLLDTYNDECAILLKWVMFGANGHITKPVGSIMKNYTKIVPKTFQLNHDCKSIVNCKLNLNLNWYRFCHSILGGIYPKSKQGVITAYINHYFTKSWEEWKYRMLKRGDLCPGNRKILDFFIINKDLLHLKDQLLKEIKQSV